MPSSQVKVKYYKCTVLKKKIRSANIFGDFFLYGLQSGFPIPEQVDSHHLCVCGDKGTNLMSSINIVLKKSGLTLKQKLRSYYKHK